MTPPAAAANTPNGHPLGFNFAVIALVVAIAGLAFAYGVNALVKARHVPETGAVTRTLGGHDLTIPVAWLREDSERSEGFAKQVELGLKLPLGPSAAMREIGVTLLPRSRARPSASLLDGVYLHQFMPEQSSGPPGLIGKPLMPVDGYANETVWYDALSASPFVAKCMAPVTEAQPGRCLRTIYLGPGIAAVYSFDADVMENWRAFDAALYPALRQIGAL